MMVFDYPHWQTPLAQQMSLLYVALAFGLAGLVWAIHYTYRARSFWPLYAFLGGGLCIVYEPLGDVLTAVAYPPGDSMQAFFAFGRAIPMWMIPNYFFFISVPLFVITRFLIEKPATLTRWFAWFAGLALFMGCFEQPGINADAWRYYASNYPITINTYPVWVAFANAQSAIVVATAFYCLRRFVLPYGMAWLLVPLLPAIFAASHVSVSLFTAAAQYATTDVRIVNLAAAISTALCVVNAWICWIIVSRTRDLATAA